MVAGWSPRRCQGDAPCFMGRMGSGCWVVKPHHILGAGSLFFISQTWPRANPTLSAEGREAS